MCQDCHSIGAAVRIIIFKAQILLSGSCPQFELLCSDPPFPALWDDPALRVASTYTFYDESPGSVPQVGRPWASTWLLSFYVCMLRFSWLNGME